MLSTGVGRYTGELNVEFRTITAQNGANIAGAPLNPIAISL